MVDGRGVPLSLAVSGANTHDSKLLEPTLEGIVIERPADDVVENLCADAAYKGAPCLEIILENHYIPHVKQRHEEAHAKKTEGFTPRRWVCERTNSWTNRFEKIHISREKSLKSFLALNFFACALMTWRQIIPIYG